MNETPRPRFGQHFSGASSVLRALAWLSVTSLAVAWVLLAASFFGVSSSWFGNWFGISLIVAFLAGMSSFCPLGGISAALVVFTFLVILVIGSHSP